MSFSELRHQMNTKVSFLLNYVSDDEIYVKKLWYKIIILQKLRYYKIIKKL